MADLVALCNCRAAELAGRIPWDYRVALYASSIARRMGFDEERIDDVRAAALLHDIGKLETSREILFRAASLTTGEMAETRKHVHKGVAMLEPVGGLLRRILPIILV